MISDASSIGSIAAVSGPGVFTVFATSSESEPRELNLLCWQPGARLILRLSPAGGTLYRLRIAISEAGKARWRRSEVTKK